MSGGPIRQQGRRDRRGAPHVANRYHSSQPDFVAIAQKCPYLKPYLIPLGSNRATIDFKSWDATVTLTRALLESDYGIVDWNIPQGYLCPATTNRANYIHWLEDLRQEGGLAAESVSVVDVGVGANCIYPLLGVAIQQWTFLGYDISQESLDNAAKILAANPDFEKKISLRHASSLRDALTFSSDDNSADPCPKTYSFTMCNPPFFENSQQAQLNPKTDCGGKDVEMVCEGGEVQFVSQLIKDSVEVQERVVWFTTMVGKKSSIKPLQAKARAVGALVVKSTEFCQGRTTRWGIAWTFSAQAAATIKQRVLADLKAKNPL